MHLGNIRDFTVDGLTLDNHGRDGVHVDGPASHGIIRNVSCDSRDDKVALVAWTHRGRIACPQHTPSTELFVLRTLSQGRAHATGSLPAKQGVLVGTNHLPPPLRLLLT